MGQYPLPFSSHTIPPEKILFERGYLYVAGIDEAGRGPLAGPVVAAAVVLPRNHSMQGVLDSKQLRPSMREKLYEMVQSQCVCYGVGIVDQWEIDRINIHQASLKAMEIAVNNLCEPVEYLLIDGIHHINTPIRQRPIKHGDRISPLIGAASILAKVVRDRIMERYHQCYPCYNFAQNKGYGTREHQRALKQHGYCSLHRKTFKGVLPPKDAGALEEPPEIS
jgi:ribonuclease HII